MKPISLTAQKQSKTNRGFPVIDCNYHAIDFEGLRCSGRPYPSFRAIGREYFQNESVRAGKIETLIFGIIACTAMPVLIDGARAASHLLGLIS